MDGEKKGPERGGGRAVHWADETAEKIIRERGGDGTRDHYTCASGITPSGTVHIGNFREIISVDLVVRALRDRGEKVRFIYSWDDYDVFRKVPPNMPKQEELRSYLRFPITMVPDPWDRDESYARHHELDVETLLPQVGINPEYLYQAQNYRSSKYAGEIRRALEHRDALREILDRFRDGDHKIQGPWWPISAFCGNCNRDETDIDRWDGEWAVDYHCNACGHRERADLREARGIKLGWRVDWPMRWAWEEVDFEPAGKDHHTQGGSFETGRLVCRELYGREAPVSFRYDFIGIKGSAGKMSSSSGQVITLGDLLRVYTPELTRYLFAGTRPNTEFTISFDLDVIKIYEDYDKTERIAWGDEKAKDEGAFLREKRIYELSQVRGGMPALKPYQVPFRHLCNLIQIADGDIGRTIAGIREKDPGKAAGGSSHLEEEQIPGLEARCRRAKYWVEECAPEEFKFRLRPAGGKAPPASLDEREKAGIRLLREEVASVLASFGDDKSCAEAIYRTAEKAGLEGKELFRAAYRVLIGKDQGPRLANFLRSIDRDRLMELLAGY
ncbi:MAG: lysine--tRNA ligase [Treponema sp.]|jgi:lysyl-tRNA synthetase class 1|nr:lysine--tRNA ligase [Treponema sp.]